MPALPSFITGRPGRKPKTGIKFPLWGGTVADPSTTTFVPTPAPVPAPPPPTRRFVTSEVIDIADQGGERDSLDFDGGKPIDEYENDLVDEEQRYTPPLPFLGPDTTVFPQFKLDIELSPEEQGLTDWFANNFPKSSDTEQPEATGSGLRTKHKDPSSDTNGHDRRGDWKESMNIDNDSSEDVISTLQSMDPSHFGKLPGYDSFNRLDQTTPKKPFPKPLTIPAEGTRNQNGQAQQRDSFKSSRPLSMMDTPASSAISGTTLARALMSNSFVLSRDSRISAYHSQAGLTRSDSVTLPRGEFADSNNDRFSIDPDAPPIPSNAGFLYEPPKRPRTPPELNHIAKRKPSQTLKRRSSTGSVHPRSLPETPSAYSTRPNSLALSPGSEFDINAFVLRSPELNPKPPSVPRSPLPPTPKLPYSSTTSQNSFTVESIAGSTSGSSQEAIQRFPVDAQLLSPDLNSISPVESSEAAQSAKNLEDVLNYYSIPDSPEPLLDGANYRPAFSPITEETSGQLSPPTPYRGDKRESQRPLGARSPLSGSIRLRGDSVPLPRVPSGSRPGTSQAPLLSVSERPTSVTQVPSPSSPYGGSFASAASELLVPPPVSNIFNRQRAGSAPSPIKVVRDSKDGNQYKLTVSPGISEGETPTSEEGGIVTQDFPETPDLFSPLYTSGTNTSSGHQPSVDGHDVLPMSNIPLSATLPGRGAQPSLAQQIFLNRAGTTITRNVVPQTHTRQASVSKMKTNNLEGAGSPSSRRIENISEEPVERSSEVINKTESTPNKGASSPNGPYSNSPEEMPVNPRLSNPNPVIGLSRSSSRSTNITQSDASSMYVSSNESARGPGVRMKSLPTIPVSPLTRSPATSSTSSAITSFPLPLPEPVLPLLAPVPAAAATIAFTEPVIPPPPDIPPPSPTLSQKEKVRVPPVRAKLPPALTITNDSSKTANTVAINGTSSTTDTSPAFSLLRGRNRETGSQSSASISDPQALVSVPVPPVDSSAALNPALPQSPSLAYTEDNDNFTGRESDIFRGTSINLGSPPPYYTVVNEGATHDAVYSPALPSAQTPFFLPSSTGTPGVPAPSTSTATLNELNNSNTSININNGNAESRVPLARESSMMGPRSRMRPPLPAGPRRPSQMMSSFNFTPGGPRDRAGSISSINSSNQLPQAARARLEVEPVYSPKFQTPSPKWRGYTMEAAKWTFTSAQLQAIVSRAIRQSAEASSIRLLRLEVLDNEIPNELARLELHRTDLKTRYKVLVRRRATLFDAFTYGGGTEEENTYVLRVAEDLHELSITLDRLVEELHSLDSQIAHLESLTHIHMGSALAMALRKLNSSFLKQVSENQALRTQVEALEAERDEAWQQAERVANEFDRLMDKGDDISSKRSSRISAVRKSSVRASKAGLRTTSQRFSQMSSHSGTMHLLGLAPASAKSPLLRWDRIPPVPPIPKRRPVDIITDSPLKSSAALSPNDTTPSSETRALLQAQDELYAMLGLKNPERPLRRSFSVGMLSASPSGRSSIHFPASPLIRPPERSTSWRRSSLPGGDALAETYIAMAADRNAVLATIDMLSTTD